MSSLVDRPLTRIINNYKHRHFPYAPKEVYRHHIEGLMSEIMEYKESSLDFKCPDDYFQAYCYVLLNPLKPGTFEYTTPAGKRLRFKYEPFYVGKGRGARMFNHSKHAQNLNINNIKVNTIRKIWKAGADPIIIDTASRVSDFMAWAFEIDLIAGIGRRDKKLGPLANLTDGGDGSTGYRHTVETRERMSESRLGHTVSEATRQKLSIAHLNRDPKINKAISAARKGMKFTDEHKQRIREANLGKTQSAESNEKRRQWSTGKRHTEAAKKKMSIARRSQPKRSLSEEHKRNVSKGLLGRRVSKETRLKISSSNSRKIQVGTKVCIGLKEASAILGITPAAVSYRIKSGKHKDLYYL